MGDATILRVGLKTMLRTKRAEFLTCTPLVTFWRYISRKQSQKSLSNKFVGARRQFGGSYPVSLPCCMPAQCSAVTVSVNDMLIPIHRSTFISSRPYVTCIFTCVSYAEARNRYIGWTSVCLSVRRPSVCHTLARYQNG